MNRLKANRGKTCQRRAAWGWVLGIALLAALPCGALLAHKALLAGPRPAGLGNGLFGGTNVWNVHLTFALDQWEAMEPKQAGGFPGFGGPRGPGGFGGPGGPGGGTRSFGPEALQGRGPGAAASPGGGSQDPFGGRPSGPGGFGGPGGGPPMDFGPGMFVAPLMMRLADENRDGKLSEREFSELGRKWFSGWDTNRSDTLDGAEFTEGFNGVMAGEMGGQRPGGPGGGGPGGPGGPGRPGRGPGMMLQGPEGKRNGLASAMGIEFAYVHADLEFDGQVYRDVGVRYKGNGTFMESRGSLKRSFKIDLNQFTQGRRLGGATVLNLHSCVTDPSYMNEVLAFRLYRDAGVPAPESAYARVYLTVPGKLERQYLGLYSLVENVDKNFLEKNFATRRGALFKPVTPRLFDFLGEDWPKYRQTYDPKTALFDEQSERMIELCRLVTSGTDAEFSERIREFIDLDNFARFLAVMVFLSDMDGIFGPGQNFYLYQHPKTLQLHFMPWDQDHSFGQFPMRGTQQQREQLSIHKPWENENRFLERMLKTEAVKAAYLRALQEFSQGIFKPARFAAQVDEFARAIRGAVAEESEQKLARFDAAVSGEGMRLGFDDGGNAPPGPGGAAVDAGPGPNRRGSGPGGPRPGPFAFGEPAKPIKPFTAIRAESVAGQLAGKAEGAIVGGGFGRGGPGGPGGPGGFGPGMFLGPLFLTNLDADKSGGVSRQEIEAGFARWFAAWKPAGGGVLTEDQLRAGINKDLSPFQGGPPPGFGGPPGDRMLRPDGPPDDER